VAQLLSRELPTAQEYVGVDDSFGESGTPEELLTKYGCDTADIIKAAENAIARK